MPGVIVSSVQHIGNPDKYKRSDLAVSSDDVEPRSVKEHEGLIALLSQKPLRLNLWCRQDPVVGYVNIGNTKYCDVACDIRDLAWIDDDIVDEILAVDAIQHFYRVDAIPTFMEWRRVMREGGTLWIEAPDIRELAKAVAESDDIALFDGQPPLVWGIDGSQNENDPKSDTNRNAMTASRCEFLLKIAGFASVRRVGPKYSSAAFRPFALLAQK